MNFNTREPLCEGGGPDVLEPDCGRSDKDDFVYLVYEAAMAADGSTLENFASFYAYFAMVEGLIDHSEAHEWCEMFEMHMPDVRGDGFNSMCCLWGFTCMA